MFEFFEHTADIGIRVVAPELNAVYEEAAQALFALIAGGVETIEPRQSFEVEVEETDRELLLRDCHRRLSPFLRRAWSEE